MISEHHIPTLDELPKDIFFEIAKNLDDQDIYNFILTSRKYLSLIQNILTKDYGFKSIAYLRHENLKTTKEIRNIEQELLSIAQLSDNPKLKKIIPSIIENNFEIFKNTLGNDLSVLSTTLNRNYLKNLKIAYLIAIFRRTAFQDYIWEIISNRNPETSIFDMPYVEWCVLCNKISELKKLFNNQDQNFRLKSASMVLYSAIDVRNFDALIALIDNVQDLQRKSLISTAFYEELIQRNDLTMIAICLCFQRKFVYQSEKFGEHFIHSLSESDLKDILKYISELAKRNSNIAIIHTVFDAILTLTKETYCIDLFEICQFQNRYNQSDIADFFRLIVKNQEKLELSSAQECIQHLITNKNFLALKELIYLVDFNSYFTQTNISILKLNFLKDLLGLIDEEQIKTEMEFAFFMQKNGCPYFLKNMQQCADILFRNILSTLRSSNPKFTISFDYEYFESIANFRYEVATSKIDTDFLLHISLLIGANSSNIYDQILFMIHTIIAPEAAHLLKNTYNPTFINQMNLKPVQEKIENIAQLKIDLDSIIEKYREKNNVSEEMRLEILDVLQKNPATPQNLYFIDDFLKARQNNENMMVHTSLHF